MDAAAYALQSDPIRNPQFRRGWEHPPPKRKRPAGQGRAADFESRLDGPTLSQTHRTAQRAAEALFEVRP